VVWANRGGGKTFLAAIATLLDLVFKDGIEIRALGGSLEQAKRMHAHLRGFLERDPFRAMLDGRITERRIRLGNGSTLELLAQSQTSVRGTRVQKLRCDEAELFDPDVWEAAQLVTRSKRCAGIRVRGSVDLGGLGRLDLGGGYTQGDSDAIRAFAFNAEDASERSAASWRPSTRATSTTTWRSRGSPTTSSRGCDAQPSRGG